MKPGGAAAVVVRKALVLPAALLVASCFTGVLIHSRLRIRAAKRRIQVRERERERDSYLPVQQTAPCLMLSARPLATAAVKTGTERPGAGYQRPA